MSTNITKILGVVIGTFAIFVMFFVVAPEKAEAIECPIGQVDVGGSCVDYEENPEDVSSANLDNTEQPPEFGCSFSAFDFWGGVKGCMAAVSYTIMSFFAIFLGVAGLLLNGAVELTVRNIGPFVNGVGDSVTGIELAWKLFRDLGNIVILFVLLFSAIGIIFRTDNIVPRKTLGKVIIAAFLINFSLFFTKAIIDVSNVFTFTIHNEIQKISETNDDNLVIGVAGSFMNGLDPITIYRSFQKEAALGKPVESHIFQQMIFGTIVLLVATFVFLVMAAMLLIRFVILLFLLVTSPIGFVGGLIPKLQKYSTDWWNALLGQAMFAPVLMLFILISILLINSPGFKDALNYSPDLKLVDSNVGSFLGFAGSGVTGIIQYVVVIGLLITGLVVAKKTAGDLGKGAVSWVSKKAGSLAFGATAAAGSYSIGRFGGKLADSQFANTLQGSSNFAARLVGRGLINTGKWTGKRSFDIRGTSAGKQLDAEKGASGFIEREKAEKKRIEEARKKIKPDDTSAAERLALKADLESGSVEREKLKAEIKKLEGVEKSTLTTDAQKADAREKRERLEKENAVWLAREERLDKLEKQSPAVQEERQKQARKEIADLAKTLQSHQIRFVQDIMNEKNDDKRKKMQDSLTGNGARLAKAIENLSAASKNMGDIQKAGQLEWANRMANEGGPIKAAADNIRKELNKSKGKKALEDAIEGMDKEGGGKDKGEKPESETPAPDKK